MKNDRNKENLNKNKVEKSKKLFIEKRELPYLLLAIIGTLLIVLLIGACLVSCNDKKNEARFIQLDVGQMSNGYVEIKTGYIFVEYVINGETHYYRLVDDNNNPVTYDMVHQLSLGENIEEDTSNIETFEGNQLISQSLIDVANQTSSLFEQLDDIAIVNMDN